MGALAKCEVKGLGGLLGLIFLQNNSHLRFSLGLGAKEYSLTKKSYQKLQLQFEKFKVKGRSKEGYSGNSTQGSRVQSHHPEG